MQCLVKSKQNRALALTCTLTSLESLSSLPPLFIFHNCLFGMFGFKMFSSLYRLTNILIISILSRNLIFSRQLSSTGGVTFSGHCPTVSSIFFFDFNFNNLFNFIVSVRVLLLHPNLLHHHKTIAHFWLSPLR